MLASCFTVSAAERSLVSAYTKDGEKKYDLTIVAGCIDTNSDELPLDDTVQLEAPAESIYSVCDNYDYLLTYDFKTKDSENLYPDIEEMKVKISMPQLGGGRNAKLGKNFRLYHIGTDTVLENADFNSFSGGISFTLTKLGRYALYFDEAVYDVTFYSDLPSYNEDGDLIEQQPYKVIKDLKAADQVIFPEIPEKSGFVFTGWKTRSGSGFSFVQPQPHTALNPSEYYASWCSEEEYKPLEIHITSDKTITKGKENGQIVTVKLSDGFFDISRDDLSDTGNWKLTGADDIAIEKIEPVDNKTIKLTLSGNSKDVYSTAAINAEFNSDLIIFETTDDDGQPVTEPEKIQLDADGVKAAWYKTTDTLTLNRQSKSSGGGRTSSTFSVKFDTNGGSSIATKTVKRNETIGAIETPVKDGFVFDGWYSDKSLTKVFDINTKIVSSMTLYAKWVENPGDNSKNELVLTVGKKDASVFGETKENDVSPVIRNGRTMLPARFVAENLGATVSWNEEKQLVSINGKNENDENVLILITIGAEYAEVNGENIKLDAPAFIENDRTYTPIRFVSERLGAKVDWNENEQKVIITRNAAENE